MRMYSGECEGCFFVKKKKLKILFNFGLIVRLHKFYSDSDVNQKHQIYVIRPSLIILKHKNKKW